MVPVIFELEIIYNLAKYNMKIASVAFLIIVMAHIVLSDPTGTNNLEKNLNVEYKNSLHECAQCIADQTKKVWSDLVKPLVVAYWWDNDLEDKLWGQGAVSCSTEEYYTGPATYVLCPPDVNVWGVERYIFDEDSAEKIITYNNSNIKYRKEGTYLFKNEINALPNGYEELIQNFKTYPCKYVLMADKPSIFGYDVSILSIKDAEVFVYVEYRYKQIYPTETSLKSIGDSVSVNIAKFREHGGYVRLVVVPKSMNSSVSIQANARDKIYFDQDFTFKLIYINLIATTIISVFVLLLWLITKRFWTKTQNPQDEVEIAIQAQKDMQNKKYTAFSNKVDVSLDTT